MTEVKTNSAYKVIEIALGKGKLDSLYVFGVYLIGVYNFEHEEEGGRRAVGFFVFFLGKLPVGHYVPDHLVLVKRRFFKLFVLEIYNLEKSEHVRSESFAVYSQLPNHSVLNVSKSIVGLDSHQNAVAHG